MIVTAVDDGSLAQQSGIEPGDELVSLDGNEVHGDVDLVFALVEQIETAHGFQGSIGWGFLREQQRGSLVEEVDSGHTQPVSIEESKETDDTLALQQDFGRWKEDKGISDALATETELGHMEGQTIVAELSNEGEGGYGLDIDLAESGSVMVVDMDVGSTVEGCGVLVGDELVRVGDVDIPTAAEGRGAADPIELVNQVVGDMEAAGHASILWTFYRQPVSPHPATAPTTDHASLRGVTFEQRTDQQDSDQHVRKPPRCEKGADVVFCCAGGQRPRGP